MTLSIVFFLQNFTSGRESLLPDAKFHSCGLGNVACLGGAIGSVAVRAAWLQRPTGLQGSRPRLAGSFVSRYSGVCIEIKLSGSHTGFDGVLFKLRPLAYTGFRGAQSLVPP